MAYASITGSPMEFRRPQDEAHPKFLLLAPLRLFLLFLTFLLFLAFLLLMLVVQEVLATTPRFLLFLLVPSRHLVQAGPGQQPRLLSAVSADDPSGRCRVYERITTGGTLTTSWCSPMLLTAVLMLLCQGLPPRRMAPTHA